MNRKDRTRNEITGGIFFSTVIQGENVTVLLPREITPALAGLPAGSSAFTGRDSDLKTLLDFLAYASDVSDGELPPRVVITAVGGLAGIGKTELAVQAARIALRRGWFPGGVLFVDLFGYDPIRRLAPGDALAGFLRAVGIPDEHMPSQTQDRIRLYRSVLTAYANEGRRILVVVDNASTVDQAGPLLPADDGNAAIVTSRETLGMLKARQFDLDVLTPRAAIAMMEGALQIARPEDARFKDHPVDAARIARLCGFLPLALQITAALIAEDSDRPLTAMADDLEDERGRLDELSYDDITVRAAFELSYNRLNPQHARLFRLLTANPGRELSTQAAAVLAGVDQRVARRGLEALARAHLVVSGSQHGRWLLHDLVRLFANECGREHTIPDSRDDALNRLLNHYLDTARAANAHLDPQVTNPSTLGFADREHALAWLDIEYLNLTAITYFATERDTHIAVGRDLSFAMWSFLVWRRRFDDWIAFSTVARNASRKLGDVRGEARALNDLGCALREMRRSDEAIAAHQDAAEINRHIKNLAGEGAAMINLGSALQELQRFDEAITVLQQAVQIFDRNGDQYNESAALANLGLALRQVGRFEEAIAAQQKDVQICRDTNDRRGESIALDNLGVSLQEVERFEDATAAHQDAAQICRDINDQNGEARALHNFGVSLRRSGHLGEAIAAHQDTTQIFRELSDWYGVGLTLADLALALRELGRLDEARSALKEAAQIFRDAGDDYSEHLAKTELDAIQQM